MKSNYLSGVLALAACSVVSDALAATAHSGDLFVDAKFAREFGKPVGDDPSYSSDAQSSWGVGGAYLWDLDDARSAGFEVGYMHFGHVVDVSDPTGSSRGQISATAMTASGRFQVSFGDDQAWMFQARAGLMRLKAQQDYSDVYPGRPARTGSSSSTQGGTYLGLGIGRRITQSLSLILAYDRYSSNGGTGPGQSTRLDLNLIGLDAEYRF